MLALVAALAVPPFVNWDQYREAFESQASDLLGQPVRVEGSTSVRLLPLPSVTFADVSVGEGNDGQPLLRAENFHIDMELAPLLKGDVVIVNMILRKPVLDVPLDQAGQLALVNRLGNSDRGDGGTISLDNINVEDGILRIRDARFEREFILRDINVAASAKTIEGPWFVDGRFSRLDESYQIQGSTGTWKPGTKSIRLKGTVRPKSQPYDLDFDAPISFADGEPRLVGTFAVSPMLRQPAAEKIAFQRPSETSAYQAFLTGSFDLQPIGLSVPDYQIELGDRDDPYILKGAAVVEFGENSSFSISANGQQIDIARMEMLQSGVQSQGGRALTLSDRIKVIEDVLNAIPRFEADGEVSLTLPAMVVGDTTIRDLQLQARPSSSRRGWDIGELTALLPGRTQLEAAGTLVLGEFFGYEGQLLVASQQPSGFANWVSGNTPAAVRNLSSAGFEAQATIDRNRLHLRDMEIVLGGAQLRGDVMRSFDGAEGQGVSTTARLSGQSANFDQLLALLDMFGGQTPNSAQNFSLALDARQLTIRGIEASEVIFQGDFTDGTLSVQELSVGDVAGAALTVTGAMRQMMTEPEGRFEGTIATADPAEILALVEDRLPGLAGVSALRRNAPTLGDANLNWSVESGQPDEDRLVFALRGSAGGTQIVGDLSYLPDMLRPPEDDEPWPVDGEIALDNPNAARLLQQLGLPVSDLVEIGAGAISATVSGDETEGFQTVVDFAIAGSTLRASGNLASLENDGAIRPMGTLDTVLEISDLDPFILLAGLPVPGLGDRNALNAKLALTLDEDSIAANDLTGALEGVGFSGSVAINHQNQPRPLVSGQLRIDQMPFSLVPLLVYGPEGGGDAVFTPLFSGLDGDVKLSVPVVTVKDAPSLQDASLVASIRDGDLAMENIEAKWFDGSLSGLLTFARSGSTRILSGQLKLDDAALGAAVQAAGVDAQISGRVDMAGTFEGTGETRSAITDSLTGNGSYTIRDGTLFGLNDQALPAILAGFDAERRDEAQLSAAELEALGLFDGTFAFDEAEGAFTLASGVVRGNGIRVTNTNGQLTGDLRIDLRDGSLEGGAKLAFEPGREAMPGAAPEVDLAVSGPVGDIRPTVDPTLFSTFLGMRLAQQREREFESQKQNILERQRLLRRVSLISLEQRERDRLAQERLEQQRIAEEMRRAAETRAEAERLERERLAREEAERLAREEEARLEAERLAEEARLEAERLAEAARLEAERLEEERLAEEARLEAERLERERLAEEARLEAERQAEEARLAAERREAERLAEEARLEAERLAEEARLEVERREAERIEAERLAEEARQAEEAKQEEERLQAEREAQRQLLEEQRKEAEREAQRRAAAERLRDQPLRESLDTSDEPAFQQQLRLLRKRTLESLSGN